MPAPGDPTPAADPPALVDRSWTPGDARPLLTDHDVHVWRAPLEGVPERLIELLCDAERERAERIGDAQRRRRWSCARGVLRDLLGRYLTVDPRAVRLDVSAHGKPLLREEPRAPLPTPSPPQPILHFNLSHSGELALYAFSRGGPVGVDVELARRRIDELALARRALGEGAAQRLSTLDANARRQEFLRLWTRHEALLKCRGSGFAGAEASERASAAEWLLDLDLGLDAGESGAGALAGACPAGAARCFAWSAGV